MTNDLKLLGALAKANRPLTTTELRAAVGGMAKQTALDNLYLMDGYTVTRTQRGKCAEWRLNKRGFKLAQDQKLTRRKSIAYLK